MEHPFLILSWIWQNEINDFSVIFKPSGLICAADTVHGINDLYGSWDK